MFEAYVAQMRAEGYRMTPQRLAILRILHDAGKHLTPIEVYQQASHRMPGLTEATVYRTLTFLAAKGLVLVAHVGNGQLVYEIGGHAHHHLICLACGHTCEVEHDVLKRLYEQFHACTGFQVDMLHQTFFGLCPDCALENQAEGIIAE